MPTTVNYLAIDLGASGGRAVLGCLDGGTLALRELHRFPNTPVSLPTGLHWDTPRLFREIKQALSIAARDGGAISGVGIDTWGVDYALLAASGELLSLPHHYRDARTRGMMEEVFRIIPRERIYERTGIQFMALNTLYQLMAERACNDSRLGAARRLLFTPDLLNYWLTGVQSSERSIASTSQLFDTGAGVWATDLVRALGLPEAILPEVAAPGTPVGALLPSIAEETGASAVTVIAPAGHDTGSAVAAVPAPRGDDWAYVSCGTWSLVGRELRAPVRTAAALEANFTNECGVAGTIRFHRNLAGLWLLQECRRLWAQEGRSYTYDELAALALGAPAFASMVDPDDDSFAEPCDMPARIRSFCGRTGQAAPDSDGAIARCILESLALKCRLVIDDLERLTSPVRTIHMVGGGARNEVLCRFTAGACGRLVLAGPVEATAAGNVMVQAMAERRVASLEEIREVVARSVPVKGYEASDAVSWANARERFRVIMLRERGS